MTPLKFVKLIAECASDKKATEITVLDMRKVANVCDYFIICTGNTDRQVRAVALGIEEKSQEMNLRSPKKQGLNDSRWIVMDFGDVVVHIFEKFTREFYGLDYLWQDAKKVDWEK